MQIWFTIFVSWPAPASPMRTSALAYTLSTSFTASKVRDHRRT